MSHHSYPGVRKVFDRKVRFEDFNHEYFLQQSQNQGKFFVDSDNVYYCEYGTPFPLDYISIKVYQKTNREVQKVDLKIYTETYQFNYNFRDFTDPIHIESVLRLFTSSEHKKDILQVFL